MPSEREFIEELRSRFPPRSPVTVGIGDDGAVLTVSGGAETVVVTDMLLDGVHFDLAATSPALIGRKAVAVNLSDLAAMGCHPEAAFVCVAVPDLNRSAEMVGRLFDGIAELAESRQFTVAGGDTNTWNGPVVISVCLTGRPLGPRPVLRSGARPGDVLLVSGPLGGSLRSGRHLTFEPRIDLAGLLANRLDIHAMIDISDGLAIDLHRLMDASGTGAVIDAARIPVHSDVPAAGRGGQAGRVQAALTDGEDFELLLAVADDDPNLPSFVESRQLYPVGTVTAEPGCRLRDESGEHILAPGGWQHG